ncbi:fap1 adhesin-like [Heterodontus francisci]|uniref:fap1 adhesin-like n=1 Tax=Heterodontus francisci TaxID=7792 RepID=UPI00355B4002
MDSLGDSLTDSIKDGLKNSFRDDLKDSVRDSLKDSVRDSLKDSVRDSLKDSVRDSLKDSVRDSLKDSVRDSLKDSVRDSLKDSVRDSLKDSVRDSLKDSVRDSLKDSVRDSLKDSVRDSLKDSVRDSLKNSLRDSLTDSVRDSLKNSLRDSLKDGLRDGLKDGLRDDLKDSVRDSLKDGLRDSLTDSVRDGLKDGLRDDLKDSVRDSLKDGLRDSLTDSVRDGLKDGLRDGLRKNLKKERLRMETPNHARKPGTFLPEKGKLPYLLSQTEMRSVTYGASSENLGHALNEKHGIPRSTSQRNIGDSDFDIFSLVSKPLSKKYQGHMPKTVGDLGDSEENSVCSPINPSNYTGGNQDNWRECLYALIRFYGFRSQKESKAVEYTAAQRPLGQFKRLTCNCVQRISYGQRVLNKIALKSTRKPSDEKFWHVLPMPWQQSFLTMTHDGVSQFGALKLNWLSAELSERKPQLPVRR